MRILGERNEIELLSKGRGEWSRIHKHRLRGDGALDLGVAGFLLVE